MSTPNKQVHHAHGHHYTRPRNESSTLGTTGEFSVNVPDRFHGLSSVAHDANVQEAKRREEANTHRPHSLEDLADIVPQPEESNWHWVETGDVGKLAWAKNEDLPQLPPCDITPVDEYGQTTHAGTSGKPEEQSSGKGDYQDMPDGSAILL